MAKPPYSETTPEYRSRLLSKSPLHCIRTIGNMCTVAGVLDEVGNCGIVLYNVHTNNPYQVDLKLQEEEDETEE